MSSTARYDWILGLTSIAFIFAAFGNGANDVANAYATSVAAKTLTMPQVGVLSVITEFIGAVALGARVTDTIKNDIIDINRFEGRPGVLMLAMGCAEVGNAFWLMTATSLGFPVSTTQTIVGSLVGVGLASQASISWSWSSGGVAQVAASWGIAPAIACGMAAILFGTLKFGVLERKDSFKWAMRLIPIYLAGTAAILALFISIEAPSTPFEEESPGTLVGIILGVFAGVLVIGYVFFIPFFKRKLVHQDPRIRIWHLPLGPLLLRENPPIYWPGKGDQWVENYYEDAYGHVAAGGKDDAKKAASAGGVVAHGTPSDSPSNSLKDAEKGTNDPTTAPAPQETDASAAAAASPQNAKKAYVPPYERFVGPVEHLSPINPMKWWGWLKFVLLQGVTRDVVTHDSDLLRAIHSKAHRYDLRVEHMWTYCQVVSAIMMSIAHGSNDVANAVGPWAASYATFRAGEINTSSPTPVWMLVVAGLLLGLGFWFFGFKIIRALGNKIQQMSPTRGFATELGAAITVLLASRLGLPVSTTQCLTGASIGVALMNFDLGAVNWRQLGWIFCGWVLTLPAAGLCAGLLMLMAVNAPSFYNLS